MPSGSSGQIPPHIIDVAGPEPVIHHGRVPAQSVGHRVPIPNPSSRQVTARSVALIIGQLNGTVTEDLAHIDALLGSSDVAV